MNANVILGFSYRLWRYDFNENIFYDVMTELIIF